MIEEATRTADRPFRLLCHIDVISFTTDEPEYTQINLLVDDKLIVEIRDAPWV